MEINKLKLFLPSFAYNFAKKIYHLLRYYNLINPNYSTSNNIYFGDKKTGNYLKEKIINSKTYLEFGSGNTTIFALENKKKYLSIESDRNFYFFLKKKNIKDIFFYSLGFVEFYSYPLFKNFFTKNLYKNKAKIYASNIFKRLNLRKTNPDLILVDGRYRVLCMLNIFIFLKENNLFDTCVILDDYKDREYYQEINNYFKIDLFGRLGVCYLDNKVNLSKIESLIEKYSDDPR